ncbi:hypothetical protein JAO73_22625 [Hymenobacter sp. BT523]|uniref:hypothetical protein n=1 Tax=Hymenobacter sp. BT523 TaxID=2795725 RepID=UPI0018EDAD50|nr:hypothetical protein [Hymenobacter sp. BT523]MBJ6111833.1 hypothetical protein [Hymenobacter sp. BT523]
MGYTLCALVGHADALLPVVQAAPQAVLVELGQGLSLMPLLEDVIDGLTNCQPSEAVVPSYFLTAHLEARILQHIGTATVGYLEAEYFGGHGEQTAVLWQGGNRQFVAGPTYGAINAVLEALGVRLHSTKEDAFDAVNLGRYRHTDEWTPD